MTYTRDQINDMLRNRDDAVERAIITLFKFQTSAEQLRADTHIKNDAGFCMTDARPGTRFARWLLGMDDNNVQRFPKKSLNHPKAAKIFRRYCKKHRDPMARARAIALKHSQQLVNVANGEVKVPEVSWR